MRNLILFIFLIHQTAFAGHDVLLASKKGLAKAKKELQRQHDYVHNLEEQIAFKEIEEIQKEIAKVNRHEVAQTNLTHEQWLDFFYQQRKVLNRIIHHHPSCRTHAQKVLDEILTLITELSDAALD